MAFVLTLIANSVARRLTAATVDAVRGALTEAGAHVAAPDWLDAAVACDLDFEGLTPGAAEAVARAALAGQPIDLAAQPRAGRRKRLLIADMESTVIAEEMLDELAEQVGLRAEIAAVTERAMRGELDFEDALTARVGKLAGLGVDALETAAGAMTLDPGAKVLVATLRTQGAVTALVSGGFSFFTERVQALCGFDRQQANTLLVAEGKLTGEVARPILGREAKLACLEALCAELAIAPAEVCAVGDGANDLAMLEAAGLGVAFHAKPLVRQAARARLDHADLTGLLYLQGYRRSDFAASS